MAVINIKFSILKLDFQRRHSFVNKHQQDKLQSNAWTSPHILLDIAVIFWALTQEKVVL